MNTVFKYFQNAFLNCLFLVLGYKLNPSIIKNFLFKNNFVYFYNLWNYIINFPKVLSIQTTLTTFKYFIFYYYLIIKKIDNFNCILNNFKTTEYIIEIYLLIEKEC